MSGRTLTDADVNAIAARIAELLGAPPPPKKGRRGRRRLPADNPLLDRDWLASAYAERSASVIAQEVDVNVKTVINWLHRHGIEVRPPGQSSKVARHGRHEARRAELVKALRTWAEQHDGRAPTTSEWTLTRPAGAPSDGSARDLFGTWNEALSAAGLTARMPGHRDDRWQRRREELGDALLVALRTWSDAHDGRSPTQSDWAATRPPGAPGDGVARDHFGSWLKALAAAGLSTVTIDVAARREKREERRRQLIAALQDWADAHDGESPTSAEWPTEQPQGCPNYKGLFRSWNEALRAAGLKTRNTGETRHSYEATPRGKRPTANRQVVEGIGFNDQRPGTIKHFGRGQVPSRAR
jgi:hypothetical protein